MGRLILDGPFASWSSTQECYPESCVSCRYRAFRDDDGHYSQTYWTLLAIRLAFVIVFEVSKISESSFNDSHLAGPLLVLSNLSLWHGQKSVRPKEPPFCFPSPSKFYASCFPLLASVPGSYFEDRKVPWGTLRGCTLCGPGLCWSSSSTHLGSLPGLLKASLGFCFTKVGVGLLPPARGVLHWPTSGSPGS